MSGRKQMMKKTKKAKLSNDQNEKQDYNSDGGGEINKDPQSELTGELKTHTTKPEDTTKGKPNSSDQNEMENSTGGGETNKELKTHSSKTEDATKGKVTPNDQNEKQNSVGDGRTDKELKKHTTEPKTKGKPTLNDQNEKQNSDRVGQTIKDAQSGPVGEVERHKTKAKNETDGKPTNDKNEKQNGNGSWASKKITSAILFVISLIACFGFVFVSTKTEKSNSCTKPLSNIQYFESKLSNMQQEFPNQTSRFWRLLRNPTRAHINNTSPKKPLVIMLAASPEAYDVLDCLAKKLASAIDRNFNKKFEIHGKEQKENDGHEVKKMIDNQLKHIYGQKNNVSLLHNLELLPPPAPILFYSYCDDQNAPFKEAAIIFTVQLPSPVQTHLSDVEKEGSVNDYLQNQVWSGNEDVYGEDRIGALLSRITDTVALVQQEKNLEACNSSDLYCTASDQSCAG